MNTVERLLYVSDELENIIPAFAEIRVEPKLHTQKKRQKLSTVTFSQLEHFLLAQKQKE